MKDVTGAGDKGPTFLESQAPEPLSSPSVEYPSHPSPIVTEMEEMNDPSDDVAMECIPDSPKNALHTTQNTLSGSEAPMSPTRSHNLSAKSVRAPFTLATSQCCIGARDGEL